MRLFTQNIPNREEPAMARAYDVAWRGLRRVSPNPLVGCVILAADGTVVGEGWHDRYGAAHAEVNALTAAGARAAGATAYVTLEPCNHTGHTGPCAQALIEAGVTRVVIGMPDPNPRAAGGADALRAAGVAVEFVADSAPFAEQNAGFLTRLHTGKPQVCVKEALSLDAHPALRVGERLAVTGTDGAAVTRTLRSWADAVLVSAATVDADDPALTLRAQDGTLLPDQPRRVVLVRSRLPRPDAALCAPAPRPTVLLVPAEHPAAATLPARYPTCEILSYARADGLDGALRALGSLGINRLAVEAGPRLFTALHDAGAIDLLLTVTAGGLLGATAPALYTGAPAVTEGALAAAFVPLRTELFGTVVATLWRPAESGR